MRISVDGPDAENGGTTWEFSIHDGPGDFCLFTGFTSRSAAYDALVIGLHAEADMIPHNAMPRNRAAVLASLHHIYRRDGRCTVRAIADDQHLSTSTTWHHLRALRRAGLVTWEPRRAGTLRPDYTLEAVRP